MRFSINIPNFGDFADAKTVVTVAAEQAGWDALFVWDHVVHDKRQRQGQPFGDPWMRMTAAALATSRFSPVTISSGSHRYCGASTTAHQISDQAPESTSSSQAVARDALSDGLE